ncbi:hypothetical protein PIROE2DRAFT_59268 [Piromyces sp. E2]|nr:hypothetical protein PIROE2DRAFT_59268 [Piromyces sp. E2]|eukprot:OUM66596.1 hypothetical protein PIROE2DRAFT_59268 [Piromyces sp. E2]
MKLIFLKAAYNIKEDSSNIIEEIKDMKIPSNGDLNAFNKSYLEAYEKLPLFERHVITVTDYVIAIEYNKEAWSGVQVLGTKKLKEAMEIAERYEKVAIKTRLRNEERRRSNPSNLNRNFSQPGYSRQPNVKQSNAARYRRTICYFCAKRKSIPLEPGTEVPAAKTNIRNARTSKFSGEEEDIEMKEESLEPNTPRKILSPKINKRNIKDIKEIINFTNDNNNTNENNVVENNNINKDNIKNYIKNSDSKNLVSNTNNENNNEFNNNNNDNNFNNNINNNHNSDMNIDKNLNNLKESKNINDKTNNEIEIPNINKTSIE